MGSAIPEGFTIFALPENVRRRLLDTHSLVATRLPLTNGRTMNIHKPIQPDG
jgi:hypothetical protein